jgi:hypothetical protein
MTDTKQRAAWMRGDWITSPEQLQALADTEDTRLQRIQIRYRGKQEGRLVCAAQDAGSIIEMLTSPSSQCYVRDIEIL